MAQIVLTPNGGAVRGDAAPITLTANLPIQTWGMSGGALSVISANQALWTPPNRTGQFTVTGDTPGHTPGTVVFNVTGVLLHAPSISGSSGAARLPVRNSTMEAGNQFWRRRGIPARHYELSFLQRIVSDAADFQSFWDWHSGNGKKFYWQDPFFQQDRLFYFDDDLVCAPQSLDSTDLKTKLIEAVSPQQTRAPAASNVLPLAPDFGYELKLVKSVIKSHSLDWQRTERQQSGSGTRRKYGLLFLAREKTDLLLMEQFWAAHYPGKPVQFTEPIMTGLPASTQYYLESDLEWTWTDFNLCEFRMVLGAVNAQAPAQIPAAAQGLGRDEPYGSGSPKIAAP